MKNAIVSAVRISGKMQRYTASVEAYKMGAKVIEEAIKSR